MLSRLASTAALLAAFTFTVTTPASAALMELDVSDFGPGSALTTFGGVDEGTEVNGRTIDGLTFAYSGIPGAATVVSRGFSSPEITDPVLEIFDVPFGMLTITFTTEVTAFGTNFVFPVLQGGQDVLTIEVLSQGFSLGARSFDSAALVDSFLFGGFAGIGSDEPFDQVVLTFDEPSTFILALDNLRTIPATIPEPTTISLLGIAALAALRRRR